jgi:hypothetical protein
MRDELGKNIAEELVSGWKISNVKSASLFAFILLVN